MVSYDDLKRFVRGALRSVEARLAGMVVRGDLKSLEDGARPRAQLSLTADEVQDDLEVISVHGLSSRPGQGEGLVFSVGGRSTHRVAVVYDPSTRLQGLESGEAALYIGTAGQHVKLCSDGSVEVRAKGTAESSIVLKANGDIEIVPGPTAKVHLGGTSPVHAAIAEQVQARLDSLKAAISGWTAVPQDGGAALKVALAGWLAGSNDVASSNVRVKA